MSTDIFDRSSSIDSTCDSFPYLNTGECAINGKNLFLNFEFNILFYFM